MIYLPAPLQRVVYRPVNRNADVLGVQRDLSAVPLRSALGSVTPRPAGWT